MCGIVGQIVNEGLVDATNFNAMRDTLSHRGPDGFGSEFLENGRVALGHRRLSIIDLSEHGAQPMTNEDGTVWLTFNGEIYNYKQLREQLVRLGHRFESETDSEVIIHGYEEWNTELFSKLMGMFAFALFDSHAKTLLIVRDRFGIKPLYYYINERTFIFSSELKAICRSSSFKKEIDWSSALDFFVYRFIPTPKSIWKNVKKLEPASYLRVKLDCSIDEPEKYWHLDSSSQVKSGEEVVENFDSLLSNSVREHLVSDVPIGVFLSGGYDSTAMTYYMYKLGYPIKSFSIGFKDWRQSEHVYARRVSELFETHHTERILNEEKVDAVERLAYYYDEPQGGSSFMPTFEVCALAREKVKVVISGDGGDEVLAGYSWHRHIMKQYRSDFKGLLRRMMTPNLMEKSYHDYLSWTRMGYIEANELFNSVIPKSELPNDLWVYKQKMVRGESPLKMLQRLDITTFMLDVFLPKVDRASMANSIEVRVPFLDHRLMEFTFGLDPSMYFDNRVTKPLLNSILRKTLPDDILNRPKQGFGSPLEKKYEAEKIINEISNGVLMKDGILNEDVVKGYINQNQISKLWALYIFENWYRRWS